MEKEWGIKKLKLADLVPNGSNPRTITEAQLNKLKKQINECGFHNPLIIDENNVILGGNQRFNALNQIFSADYEVYVRYPKFQLTDKQKQEIVITDNISDGEWNWDELANSFENVDLLEWGLNVPSFDPELSEDEPEVNEVEKKLLKCPCCGHINEEKAFKNVVGEISDEDS